MGRSASFGCGVGLVGFLVAATAGAQTVSPPPGAPKPATVSTNAQDYSQGFKAFVRMGLPDTSKARYVKLDYYGGGMNDPMMYAMHELQMAGNAWLVSENKDDKSVLVSSSGRTLELYDQRVFAKRQEAEARSNVVAQAAAAKKGGGKHSVVNRVFRSNQIGEAGNWTQVELSRDLAKATAFIDKKIKAKAGGKPEMRYDSFLQTDAPAGSLFLFAVFAWQNGKTQEANALAGRLFTLVGDSRKVIVGALNVMADGQLVSAADDFRKTRDWKAYSAAVSALLKKYPAGWRQAGAAKLLSEKLLTRASLVEPPPVTGEGLTEEDQKLAAALSSETNQVTGYWGGGQLWILPPAKAYRQMKDESALGRIKARGVKSIPLLIALASDETLCPLRRSEVGMPTYGMSFGGDDRRSEEERTQTAYRQMDRPVTRGEIARSLLTPLSKREENARYSEGEEAPEEVVEEAKQVYATVKALPASGLAKHFLSNGDQNQKQAAISYMLENDFETNAPVIEAFLLTPPSDEQGAMMMGMGSGLASQYVQKRGEKAAAFVEKYAAMRKKVELPANMAENADYVKMMEKQAEGEIKTLRAMVKQQDLSEVVADLAKSGDENEYSQAAYTTLGRLPPAKAIPALLAVAVNSTNVAVRQRIIQMMPMLRYSGMQETMQEEGAGEQTEEAMEAAMKKLAEKSKQNIGTNAAQWKILMADTRGMPEGAMFGGGTYEWTIADLAASSIETLYGDASQLEQFGRGAGAQNLRPDVMMKIMRARAEARLAGKPEDQLPKMPSSGDVTAERRKAISADVLKAMPATLGKVLESLTDAESLYLAEAAGENEAIMKALAPLSRIVTDVKTPPSFPAAELARLKKLEGTMVSTNTITVMREVCKGQLAAGKALVVSLSSGGLGRGLRLAVTPVDEKMMRRYGYASMFSNMGGRKGMVQGMLMHDGSYGNGMWLVDLPEPAKVSGASATGSVAAATAESDDNSEDRLVSVESSLESQNDQFETAAEGFCNPDEALGQGASVSFTGILPPSGKGEKAGGGQAEEVSLIEGGSVITRSAVISSGGAVITSTTVTSGKAEFTSGAVSEDVVIKVAP